MRGSSGIFIGIDFGTSGCRLSGIDVHGAEVLQASQPLPPAETDGPDADQSPNLWWDALCALLADIPPAQRARIEAIAIDGTSGTVLVADAHGCALTPALMYFDARALDEATRIAHLAPATSGAHGATSSLAKLLWLSQQQDYPPAARALHQADWLANRLAGQIGISDENNALKLGYDPVARRWPDWLTGTGLDTRLLPEVLPPGTAIGPVDAAMAHRLGLPAQARVVTGTTDSIAAFLATGADRIGDAASSLGSTLVLKVLSDRPVFDPAAGVYSHRLWDRWLAGGASNTGGAVLEHHFTRQHLDELTSRMNPERATGLDYYPLVRPGERFPVSDPALAPRLSPRPADDALFLQGMLEGIAAIERQGYRLLEALGAPYPARVFSVGGGAANTVFTRIRERLLDTRMATPLHTEAAFGAALLARRGALAAHETED
ncbi:MAG TPA: carbohydrate kinase [Thioalkalivibrio sp.]|nr:carbohydrate kinase [Thioalkalivibrio sp.]